jgi:signal transduction histidine kinase
LFDQLELLLQQQLESQGIQLHKELQPQELVLFGDQTQIEQVLINLMHNAIQALEEAPQKEIHLKGFIDEAGKIILEVTDSGKGIEEEALGKIFIPFFTTKQKGSGIGLSLSKQIMRRHKGNIQVRSELGKGTSVKLIFNG